MLLFAGVAAYVLKLWMDDLASYKAGKPFEKALPGATTVPINWVLLGAGIAVAIVGIETVGEYALGVSSEQSDVYAIALTTWIAAGFIEELMFRGFLIDYLRKRMKLWTAIYVLSGGFALLHFQYWIELPPHESLSDFSRDMGLIFDARPKISAKSLWTLFILFINSLLFYALRFMPQNKNNSLLPCIVAHVASNLGVFVVKLGQGHVVGLWPEEE